MEAGGIEPPSRDTSEEASTCVAVRFNLGLRRPAAGSVRPSGRECLARTSRRLPARASLLFSPRRPAGVIGGTGGLFRPPCATVERWQLLFSPGVLPGLLTTWTRHLDLMLPGRAHFAPSWGTRFIIAAGRRKGIPGPTRRRRPVGLIRGLMAAASSLTGGPTATRLQTHAAAGAVRESPNRIRGPARKRRRRALPVRRPSAAKGDLHHRARSCDAPCRAPPCGAEVRGSLMPRIRARSFRTKTQEPRGPGTDQSGPRAQNRPPRSARVTDRGSSTAGRPLTCTRSFSARGSGR